MLDSYPIDGPVTWLHFDIYRFVYFLEGSGADGQRARQGVWQASIAEGDGVSQEADAQVSASCNYLTDTVHLTETQGLTQICFSQET